MIVTKRRIRPLGHDRQDKVSSRAGRDTCLTVLEHVNYPEAASPQTTGFGPSGFEPHGCFLVDVVLDLLHRSPLSFPSGRTRQSTSPTVSERPTTSTHWQLPPKSSMCSGRQISSLAAALPARTRPSSSIGIDIVRRSRNRNWLEFRVATQCGQRWQAQHVSHHRF